MELTINKEKGVKFDKGKTPLFLAFLQFKDSLKEIYKCSEAGHNKYKEHDKDFKNFERVVDMNDRDIRYTYLNAELRHLSQSEGELIVNEEENVYHIAQCAWNILAHIQLLLNEKNDK